MKRVLTHAKLILARVNMRRGIFFFLVLNEQFLLGKELFSSIIGKFN